MHPVRYAKSGDVSIAYQCFGDGPTNLVIVPGWVSNIEWQWEDPGYAHFLRRLGAFSRVLTFDKRGTGLSDRLREDELPGLETRMDDLRAVMDDAGLERATLLGFSEGGSMSVLFAATYPERTTGLLLCGAFARFTRSDDYPWAATLEQHRAAMALYREKWGAPIGLKTFCPSLASDERFRSWWATFLRLGASPAAAIALYRMNVEIDVRQTLSSVSVPTRVLHRSGDLLIPIENGRYLAEHIPGARLVELPGEDHFFWAGDAESVLREIESFLTGIEPARQAQRTLATVLFVDIVQSTEKAAEMGDRSWRVLLQSYYALAEREIQRQGGLKIDTAGDGILASFDGPARAVRCALALRDGTQRLGVEVRAGLHTGECELLADKLSGIAVHIGARVAGLAAPGEILVSSTVRDLVAGSGLHFRDRGKHELRGVPEPWDLFAVLA